MNGAGLWGWHRRLQLFLYGTVLMASLHLLQIAPHGIEYVPMAAPTLEEAAFASLLPQNTEVASSPNGKLSNSKTSRGRRLFLGIFTAPIADGRLRNVIRKTYLSMESNKPGPYRNGTSLPSTCSLANFAKELAIHPANENCQVVYSFVAEGKYRDRFSAETDLMYLNLTTGAKESFNRVHVLFRHLLSLNWTDAEVERLPFDFVAYTHSRLLIFPNRIWPPEMFWSNGGSSIYEHPKLYSGIDSNATDSSNKEAPSSRALVQDLVILSRDLIKTVLKPPFHRRVKNADTETAMEKILFVGGTEVGNRNGTAHGSGSATVFLPLSQGVSIVDGSRYNYMDFLQQWDNYKDAELVTYDDPMEEARVRSNPLINGTINTCHHGPRFLLGIFTVQDDKKEVERRKAIRETYLSYYRSSVNETQRDRICSLIDLISPDHPNREHLIRDCQMAYVFVVGGNPDGPTERVEFSDSEPLTLPVHGIEGDIVMLNIRENMKEGKSQSFLKYATTIGDEHVYFDYIGKTDTDTLIYSSRILDSNINQLPRFPDNVRVYGGSPRSKIQIDHLKGPAYFVGAFYWMSVDLARYITSPECDRNKLKVYSEDKSIGNFVHSHPLPIRRVKMKMFTKGYEHPLKNIVEFRARWHEHVTHNLKLPVPAR